LARDTYESEISCANWCIAPPCIPDYAPYMCEICHCSDHDSNSCPCYISDGGFARLSMIEAMNEQQIEFANKMWEYDLSHETDFRFSSPRLDVNLCDDGASFPLEFKLEKILNPSLTTLPIVAPSSPSTFRNNSAFIMTFSDTSFPLAQLTEFKVRETFGIRVSVDEDDACSESGDAFIRDHDLNATPVVGSYVDAVATILTSPDLIDDVSPDPLDTFHVFSLGSLPSPSPKCRNMSLVNHHDVLKTNVVDCVEPLGTFRGYDPSLDPYSLYLGSMPAKIMLPFAFDHSNDFSRAFDKFRRALTIMSRFLFKCSYSHSSELYAQVFDKLL